jgi:mannan endo-1,4-beta-mannosidase
VRKPSTDTGRRVTSLGAALALTVGGLSLAAGAAPAEPAWAGTAAPSGPARIRPVDPDATPETVALFENMYALSGRQWMYGHQMDMAIGYPGATGPQTRDRGVPPTATAFVGTRDRHDDNSATRQAWGQHTAVQGIDIGYLELKGEFERFGPMTDGATSRPGLYPAGGRGPFYGYDGLNVDGYPWDDLVRWVVESYRHGSVVAVSWHETNPVTYGGYGANLYRPGTWPGHGTVPADRKETAATDPASSK